MKIRELQENKLSDLQIRRKDYRMGRGPDPDLNPTPQPPLPPMPVKEPEPAAERKGYVVLINGKEWTEKDPVTREKRPLVFDTYDRAYKAGQGTQRTRRVTIDIRPYKGP